MSAPEIFIGGGDGFGVAVESNLAVFDEDGAVAEFDDVVHVVSNQDDGLIAVERSKVIVAFLLEGSVSDGENFVEEKDVAFGTDGNGKGEANLHSGGIIFELLVLEFFELGESPDFFVHIIDFFAGEAEEGAIKINIFAAGEFGVEANAKFNKGDESAVDGDFAFFGVVDAGESFEQGGFAGAIAPDDADEFAFFDVEIKTI